MISNIVENIETFTGLSLPDAIKLAQLCTTQEHLEKIMACAEKIRVHFHGQGMDLCSIINARSGKCSENCRFCAQSAHHNTDVETYSLVKEDEVLACARENDKHGVGRFSLVTAGRAISEKFLQKIEPMYSGVQKQTNLDLCASMGFLTEQTAKKLVAMGVTRYHCNLETSKSFFPSICTTHSWDEKVATIKIAREAGMDVCSGGIIGLGETMEQRIELACELRELGVNSIPLNILNPIPNTPLENVEPLTEFEILLSFSLFRLINPQAIIRSAGGRNLLKGAQKRLFQTGINGAIVGDYLTTSGDGLKEDIALFKELGFDIKRS